VIGPFPAEWEENDLSPNRFGPRSFLDSFGASLPDHPSTDPSRAATRNTVSASVTKGEWHSARIVSLRNLRLPVHALKAGQVGTVGIVFDIPQQESSNGPFERLAQAAPRLRKGLVMAIPTRHMIETGHTLQAASGFTASFEDSDINSVAPGSLCVVYM
jgi:hypothetical protein